MERILWSSTTGDFCESPGRFMLPGSPMHFSEYTKLLIGVFTDALFLPHEQVKK